MNAQIIRIIIFLLLKALIRKEITTGNIMEIQIILLIIISIIIIFEVLG
jgi:hypothetical protein